MNNINIDGEQQSRRVSDLVVYFDNISSELEARKTRKSLHQYTGRSVRNSTDNNPKSAPGKLNKSDKIIEELLTTEEAYFQTLRHIIGNYIFYFKKELEENIFKDLEDLGRYQITFYVDLLENKSDSEKIGHCFLKHKQLFHHYKIYIRDMYDLFDIVSKRYNKVAEARRKEIGDSFRLADQLLTPFQRLTRYILLLRNLLEQQQNNGSNKVLKDAIMYLESIVVELNLNTLN